MNNSNHFDFYHFLHKGYEIGERIGSGGMSEVFKGRNYYLNRYHRKPLAIKQLKPEFLDCESALYSFETEFLITQNLIHENVINIHDFVISKQHVFLAMDLLDGATLNKIDMNSGNQYIYDKTRLVLEILKAIAFIHSNSVIHGDIKPTNIFITLSGSVKIIDFGLSASESRAPSDASYAVSLKYSSPQRLLDGRISYKDDVYALGCIIYKILSGRHPFNDLTSLDAMHKNLSPPIIDHLDLNFQNILNRMLSFNAKNRPDNAQDAFLQISKII